MDIRRFRTKVFHHPPYTSGLLILPLTNHEYEPNTSKKVRVPPLNKVHKRIIMVGCGKRLYEVDKVGLLRGLIGGITGHKNLWNIGILHRDISLGNVVFQDGIGGFLIDLDHAIRINQKDRPEVRQLTGTKVFISIRLLQGGDHSYMDDLEPFYWVLFWVCTHYNGPGENTVDNEEESKPLGKR